MIYLAIYLLVGLLLVTLKTPIRKLVDKEIQRIHIHNTFSDEDVPVIKIALLRIILSAVLIIIYPIMLFSELKEKRQKRKEQEQYNEPDMTPESDKSWLRDRISVSEAETKHMVKIDGKNVPFGYMHRTWIALRKKMLEGDELYEFNSSDESWEHLAGREGIALVRNGEIVADIVTLMS